MIDFHNMVVDNCMDNFHNMVVDYCIDNFHYFLDNNY